MSVVSLGGSAPLPHVATSQKAPRGGLTIIWGCAECPGRCICQGDGGDSFPDVAESQQASIHRAVCKVLCAAIVLRDVFSSSQGIMALPDGFSFVHLAFISSLIIYRWLLYLGQEECWIGLWHFSWVRSIDYDLLFIFSSSFIALMINHRHSSYKQQETLNLLSTHWTVENLLSCIKLNEKAKCKVLPALRYSQVRTRGLGVRFLVY